MTSEQILREVRRRIGDVDGVIDDVLLDYTDEYIFEYIDSAINYLEVSSIIDADYTVSGTSITPAPSTIDGLLMAAHTAYAIVKHDLVKKVKSGEMGVRFKSGQDELSTIEASKMLVGVAEDLKSDYRMLVMAKLAGNAANIERTQ